MSNQQNDNHKLGREILHTHIESVLATSTAKVYWKAIDGKYLGVNDSFLEFAEFSSHDEITHFTDRELRWNDFAPLMVKNDQVIVKQETVNTFIEPSINCDGSKIHFLSHKLPLRGLRTKVVGSLGFSYQIEQTSWDRERLEEVTLMLGANAADKVIGFILAHQQKIHQLSQRQLDCLFHLSKGKTMKEIARTLSLSPRTIEHYIEHTKIKLDCYTREELFAKVLTIS